MNNVTPSQMNYIIQTKKEKNGYMYKIFDDNAYDVQLVKCDFCNKEFYCHTNRLKKRQNIFCSKKCEGNFRKNVTKENKNCICDTCGKAFHKAQNKIRNHNFCSQECEKIWRQEYYKGKNNSQYGLKGKLNSSWKSDERISVYGYKLIRCSEHPFANTDGFVFEHRLIAEKYLLTDENSVSINEKRYLNPQYIVHHLDFDRQNNNPFNLKIMTLPEHTKMHQSLQTDINLQNYCKKYNLNIEDVIANKNRFNKMAS